MKMKLYCIRDNAANEFSTPYMAKNDATAMRIYRGHMANLPPNVPANEFSCVMVGEFDNETGYLEQDGMVVVKTAEEETENG